MAFTYQSLKRLTSTAVVTGTITRDDIAAGQVDNTKLANGSVTSDKMANNSVNLGSNKVTGTTHLQQTVQEVLLHIVNMVLEVCKYLQAVALGTNQVV
jgi:hypothetical protein